MGEIILLIVLNIAALIGMVFSIDDSRSKGLIKRCCFESFVLFLLIWCLTVNVDRLFQLI